ncbi:unnamed protein product, partial [Rotaria sp. Silwood2]
MDTLEDPSYDVTPFPLKPPFLNVLTLERD